MIEPVMEALTTPVSPLESAIRPMINSAALPKVALSSPPMPWPMWAASSSVARPSQPASGITARQEQMNKAAAEPSCGQNRSTTATGTKISSQLSEGLRENFMRMSGFSDQSFRLSCQRPRRRSRVCENVADGPIRSPA